MADLVCTSCGFEARSPAGLKNHQRHKHPADEPAAGEPAAGEVPFDELAPGPTERAYVATVEVLRGTGKIEDADEALVEGGRRLARSLDVAPFSAARWRAYREYLEALRADGTSEEQIAALVRELSA